MVRRTRPQMRNCASGNLEIPGSMLSHRPGMTVDMPSCSLRNGFNGFLRDLPGDEFLFVTVAPRIGWLHAPGWADKTSARLDTSNGCQDHTTSPSATTPLVSRARRSLTDLAT